MSLTKADLPKREPDVRRYFTVTKVTPDGKNNNKYWEIQYWHKEGIGCTRYGRIGVTENFSVKHQPLSWFEGKIASKNKKGYTEKRLQERVDVVGTPNTSVTSVSKELDFLIKLLKGEANKSINKYLRGKVDLLSKAQVQEGRTVTEAIALHVGNKTPGQIKSMSQMDRNTLVGLVNDFFNAIPTQLPARPDIDELVLRFAKDLQDGVIEERLDQLDAAVDQYLATTQQGKSNGVAKLSDDDIAFNELGAKVRWLPNSHPAAGVIVDFVHKTYPSAKIQFIYLVEIPHERERYNDDDFGKFNIHRLWHGTNIKNAQHIVRQGLKVPRHRTNGWRFGPGVYHSSAFRRSWQYASSPYGIPKVLFLSDVAIGNPWKSEGLDSSMKSPKQGYHCTLGLSTRSGYGDEYIIYREPQQTIRAIVVVE